MKWLLAATTLLILASCSNDGSKVEDGFLGGIALATDKTSITSSSNSFMSGTPITLTLTTKDQNGNILISPYPLDVVFSFSGGTSTGTFTPTVDHGDGTYTTTFVGQSSGSATAIVATINGKTITGTSPVVAVTPGNFSLSNSFVTVAAGSVNSSSSVTVVLHTKDDSNSLITSGGLVVSFSKSGGSSTGSFSSVTDNADGTYTATFTGVTAGTATSIRAAIGGMNVTSTAPSLTVYAGPAAAIAVSSGNSQSAVAATSLSSNLVAVVTDANSNLVSSGMVDWTTTGNSVLFGASSSIASGLASNTLTVGTVTGNYTVTAKIHGTTTSTTFTATATPGAINNFLLSSVPTTATSGTAFNFTVTARDGYNNVKTDYVGAVHFTSSDSNSPTLPANYTFVSGDAGVKEFSFTLKTTGNKTVTVNQVAGGTPTATSSAIAVSAGLASQLIFTSDPAGSSTQAGSAMASISARVLDASGNTATGFNGTVNLAIGTNSNSGTLSGTATGTATAGNISFTGLSINKAGSGYTLVASSSGITSATSGAFAITVGPASTILVSSGDSQSAVAGSALTSSLIAVVQDSFGNPVSSGTTVNWITNRGTLGGSSSTTSTSGLASNTLTTSTTAGSATVTATINGTSTSVIFSATGTHGPASQIIYSTAPVGGTPQGEALATQPVLQIKDANNNLVTTGADATANVSLSLTSGSGGLTGTTSVAAVGGIATFSGIAIDTQGAGKIITATKSNTVISGGTTSKTVASSSLTIIAPLPGSFTISSAVSSGTNVTLTWGASSGVATYSVKYGTVSGTYGTTFSANATSPMTVTGLTSGLTYYFMVTATNSSGSKNATTEASANLTLPAFTMTTVVRTGTSAVVSWNAAAGATSYDILYDTSSKVSTNAYALSVNSVSSGATVTGLTATSKYFFRTRANNSTASALSANELFTIDIPFTAGTESSYVISDSSRVEFVGGVARLMASAQTDNAASTGATAGGFMNGTLKGVQWNNTNGYVLLNTTTNNSDLDASWAPQWSNLIGYWGMENNWNDSSSSGRNLTTTGSPSFSSNSRVGGFSGVFSGANYGSNTTSLALAGSSFTVSAWIKPNASSNYSFFFGIGAASTNNCLHFGYQNTGPMQLGFYANDLVATSYTVTGDSTAWHYYVATFNSTTKLRSIYRDGLLIASDTSASNFNGTGTLYIGSSCTALYPFNGSLDDVAVWKSALTTAQVQSIYARQSAKYSGLLTSRVLDAFSSQSWTTVSSTTTLPFYKELPGSAASESTSSYSAIGGDFMTNLVGLWHFNESTGTTFQDTSANGYTASVVGGVTLGASGILASSATTNGTTGHIDFTGPALPIYTIQLWFKPTAVPATEVQLLGTSGDSVGMTMFNGKFVAYDGASATGTSTAIPGKWYHIVITSDGTTKRLFVNGVQEISAAFTRGVTAGMYSFGYNNSTSNKFSSGSFDEAAIWSRALSSADVKELYRRGANRVKYQVRSCSASDCSDQEALTTTYKGWKGPDNSGLSYFSELYNTTNNTFTGVVSTGAPKMTFSNFSGTGLSVTTNRYFQYRAVLESEDTNSLCTYGNCSPELNSVTAGPVHYDSAAQTVTFNTSLSASYTGLSSNGFISTLSSTGCAAGAKYALSANGSAYYYWDGSAWSASTDYSTAANGTLTAANIGTFTAKAGVGTLQVKTYLKSSGTSECEIDNIQLNGQN